VGDRKVGRLLELVIFYRLTWRNEFVGVTFLINTPSQPISRQFKTEKEEIA
jgi:hypothetical protein